MAKSKLVKVNKKIEETVTGAYKGIEDTVVGAHKKIEDKFVDKYLTHEGESIEDAKKRIAVEQEEAEEKRMAEAEARAARQKEMSDGVKLKNTGRSHCNYASIITGGHNE